jgi:aspartokinase
MTSIPCSPHDLCFVHVVEGETDSLERQVCESEFVENLAACGVSPDVIEINDAGWFFTISCDAVERLRALVRSFNVAVKIQEHCERIILRTETFGRLPSLAEVIGILHKARIRIVQVSADGSIVSLLVDAKEVRRAVAALDRFSTSTRALAFV